MPVSSTLTRFSELAIKEKVILSRTPMDIDRSRGRLSLIACDSGKGFAERIAKHLNDLIQLKPAKHTNSFLNHDAKRLR